MKDLVQRSDLRFSLPIGLKSDILHSLRPEQPIKGFIKAGWTRRRIWQRVELFGAAVLLLSLTVLVYRRGTEKQGVEEVVANHVRSLLANHIADVPSSDQHTVKPWFSGKVDFSPKVTDFADKGFPLVGGRLDYMESRPVAAIVYTRRKHVINVFTYPSSSWSGPSVGEEQGYNFVHWADKSMEYWAISDLNLSELQDFAALLKE